MEKIVKKAYELLQRCGVVTFATVNEEGFPRPVPVRLAGGDERLTVWFATSVDSEKVAHIRHNMRTGVSFFDGGDSVSLMGHAEVLSDERSRQAMWEPWMQKHFPGGPSDPDYCLVKFTPGEGVFYIGEEFVKLQLG